MQLCFGEIWAFLHCQLFLQVYMFDITLNCLHLTYLSSAPVNLISCQSRWLLSCSVFLHYTVLCGFFNIRDFICPLSTKKTRLCCNVKKLTNTGSYSHDEHFPPQWVELRVGSRYRRTCPSWKCPSPRTLAWSAATPAGGGPRKSIGSKVLAVTMSPALWLVQAMWRGSGVNLGNIVASWTWPQSSWMTPACTSVSWTAQSCLMEPTCMSTVSEERWSQVSPNHC